MGQAATTMNLDEKLDEQAKPDGRALMDEIRSRVKAELEKNPEAQRSFAPMQAQSEGPSAPRKAGELVQSAELYYLNLHYARVAQLDLSNIKSHRPGFLGKLIVKFKRKLIGLLWDHLLKDHFAAEREYNANMVRLLNDVTRYVDSRDASNFWELIRKIDVDVSKALERIERIHDEQMASLRSSERRMFDSLNASCQELNTMIGKLLASSAQHEDKLRVLDGVARGLEGVVARMGRPEANGQVSATVESAASASTAIDFSYVLLENRYRGSEDEISQRLKIYPQILENMPGQVLEIGPGRGELQRLFRAAGVNSYGVEMDPAMVAIARNHGFDVREGNGLEHIANLSPGSIGGVIAVQVVEHLTHQQIDHLCAMCREKVAPGGRIIFETINPQSLLALSSNYFRDPTHVWPLHPDTLSYRMTLAGLNIVEIRKLSPVAKEAQLRSIPVEDFMTPRWAMSIERINGNLNQLNELIYGTQDYCVVAEVPAR